MAAPSRNPRPGIQGLDHLPAALIATIMTKLDVPSILSLASTCKACRSCAADILSFLPNFHLPDIAPSMDLLSPLLPPSNPYLRSLKVDCTRLDDSSLGFLLHPSLQELCLRNCADFSGRLLSELGRSCKDLRFLYLSSVAEKRGRSVDVLHLEEMLTGCTQLETLILMFDVSIFLRHSFARVWALASSKLISLEIEYISSVMVTELLSPAVGPPHSSSHPWPSILPNLQKLCLSVDYITDTMVGLSGEKLNLVSPAQVSSVEWTTMATIAQNQQPLRWYKEYFEAPNGDEPLALDMGSMGKGQMWINGQSIGRYWTVVANGSGGVCHYTGPYRSPKCQGGCGRPTQRWYHVPRSWLQPKQNLVVLVEELSGDPSRISLVKRRNKECLC